MSKAFTIDVQALHEWALENEFDPDHYSLNKLIELYDLSRQLKDIAEADGCGDNKEIMSEAESKFYDTHDTMDTTKLAKEILNENN